MYCISGSDLVWQVAAEKKRKDEEAAAREAAEKEQREREETDDRTAAKQRALDLRDSVAYHRQGPLEALLLYSRHPMRQNAHWCRATFPSVSLSSYAPTHAPRCALVQCYTEEIAGQHVLFRYDEAASPEGTCDMSESHSSAAVIYFYTQCRWGMLPLL